jgi:hypothetical protein
MHADQLFPIYLNQPGLQPSHSYGRHSNARHPYAADRAPKDPRGFQGLLLMPGARVRIETCPESQLRKPLGSPPFILHYAWSAVRSQPSNLQTFKRANVPAFQPSTDGN